MDSWDSKFIQGRDSRGWYIYIYTWNPNGPCFEWSLGLLLEGSNPKIEDISRFQVYVFTVHNSLNLSSCMEPWGPDPGENESLGCNPARVWRVCGRNGSLQGKGAKFRKIRQPLLGLPLWLLVQSRPLPVCRGIAPLIRVIIKATYGVIIPFITSRSPSCTLQLILVYHTVWFRFVVFFLPRIWRLWHSNKW